MGQRPRLTRQRRQQILDAAIEVIAERGLCETRIADVARQAGASAALVLYYFESRDRLLTEALTHAEDRFYLDTFHELTRLERATDRLARLIELSFPDGRGPLDGDWTLWMELWSRAVRDTTVAKNREALDRRWRSTIADVVRAGQSSGEFSDVDPDEVALRLAALIDGFAVQVMLEDPQVDRARGMKACLEYAAELLGFQLGEPERVPSERR